ncbi:uncharacterized protein LOC144062224 [Vanacampus margaritifer]
MCAISVKEEYEEELCRLKEENKGQRLMLDAVFKAPRLVQQRADTTKNVLPEQQDSECLYIKREVEEEEEEPGHHCGGSHTDSLLAKGLADESGTTTSAGTGCGNKDRPDTENTIAIPEGSGSNGMDSSTSTKEESPACEINTDQPLCLSREMLDEEHQCQAETESFSYNGENLESEMNTEQQSSPSLDMLDEEHQAADSFSYTEEAFVCQMHKPRSGESFHSRELPQYQRDLIVERYQSGEGYKRISKALNISWSTVKSVIVKWRKNGTTVPLPRTGRPSKIDEKTRRELVREAVKRPTATLKELQEFLASTGCSVHVTTISRLLHMSGLWGRVSR